jgi:hypothetical protein
VVTKIFSEGLPQPHSSTESFCCNTMPDDKTAGNLNCALLLNERKRMMITKQHLHFIQVVVYFFVSPKIRTTRQATILLFHLQ